MTVSTNFVNSVLLVLLLALTAQAQEAVDKEKKSSCNSFTLTTEVTYDKALSQGKLVVVTKGGAGKVRHFLLDTAGHTLNEKDYFKTTFLQLASGKYTIIVVDSKGCTKEKEFTIQ